MLVPILLFKLWSVLPKLFEWPPLRSPAHLLDRLSLFLLVGGAGFEFVTGILNIQTWYKLPGSFYPLHFYGAWVFTAAFVVHAGLKLPTMVRALRSRSLISELRTGLAQTRSEPLGLGYLVSPAPAAPTISRRGVLAFAVWFTAAVIGHDLLLMPLYTLADRSAAAVFRHIPPKLPTVQWINYLRVPVVLSGLLLLIWFPLIFRLPTGFPAATTLSLNPYLWHWLAVTGALFLLSAAALALRLRAGRHGPRKGPARGPGVADPPPVVTPGHPAPH